MANLLTHSRVPRFTGERRLSTILLTVEEAWGRRIGAANRVILARPSKTGCLITLLAAALTLLSASPLRAQNQQIKLAVIGISNPSTLEKSNIGNALVDILDSDINDAAKYTLLERSQLKQLKRELNLGQSDLANAKSFAHKGALTGADFLLLGKVSDYTYKERVSRRTEFTTRGAVEVLQYDHIAEVRVDLRLVDVATGEDVRSISGYGTDHNTGSVSFESEWNYYLSTEGQGTLSNLRTLLTNASNNAIEDAVRKLNDMYGDLAEFRARSSIDVALSQIGNGKILASLGNGQYVIGVNSTANLKVGDRFRVIGETIVKNSQGVVVYREKHNAGTLQVTDISESTRALAKLVGSSASGSPAVVPKENDTIVFDEKYGKSLRGLVVAGGQIAGGAQGDAAEAQAYLRRGNRFLGEKEFSEALEQYRQGLTAEPKNPKLLAGKAIAEAGVNDFTDAEADADKAIAEGGTIVIPIAHNHAFGYCHGSLTLQRGKVTYQPTSGNHGFTVTSGSQITISQENEGGLPSLKVRWTGKDGKDHKYDMFVMNYLTREGDANFFYVRYKAEGDAANKTTSLDQMIIHLVKVCLP